MEVIGTVASLRKKVRKAKQNGQRVGFVPTMGFFHPGHLALMERARKECDVVVVSLFVNPTQFGPDEDYASYPRDFGRDCRLAKEVGVDYLFHPLVKEVYPESQLSWVEVEKVSEGLCGDFRPGHFRGVATVVAKLFNLVEPDVAYFGEKDYQQLQVIKRMVKDLNFPIEVVGVPTVREEDGLAMSSRNTYLSPSERQAALRLSQALQLAQVLYEGSERKAGVIKERLKNFLEEEPSLKWEYIEVREPETLEEVEMIESKALVALAARVGRARLIDNVVLGRPETYVKSRS